MQTTSRSVRAADVSGWSCGRRIRPVARLRGMADKLARLTEEEALPPLLSSHVVRQPDLDVRILSSTPRCPSQLLIGAIG